MIFSSSSVQDNDYGIDITQLKRDYEATTGCYAESQKERLRERQIAKENHLKHSRVLTKILNAPGIKQLFFRDRVLCRGLTGNSNLAALLRIVICRYLTNDNQDIYLKYRDDIGYCFWHSAKDFASDTFINIHTIYKLIPKLESLGWIDIYHKQDDFGRVLWHLKLKIKTVIKRLVTYAHHQLVNFTNCNLPDLLKLTYINKEKKINNNTESEFSSNTKKSPANSSKQEKPENAGNFGYLSEVQLKPTQRKSDSRKDNKNPQVDFLVNKEKPSSLKEKPVKKVKADKFFGNSNNQISDIRDRAQRQSVVGLSGFRSAEELEEYSDRVLEYYLEIYDYETAAVKRDIDIANAKKGTKSDLLKEYLADEPLGSRHKRDWEVKRGVFSPIFLSYLEQQLRQEKQTPEQVQKEIYWHKKDVQKCKAAWDNCLKVINNQTAKLKQAQAQNRDLTALDIPRWLLRAVEKTPTIDEIQPTAELLTAIACLQSQNIKSHQKQLENKSKEVIDKLPTDHPIMQLLATKGVVSSTSDTTQAIAQPLPAPDAKEVSENLNSLLNDPITRSEGIKLAKEQDLPLLYNDEGIAIAVDSPPDDLATRNYAPHQPYVEPEIETGDKTSLSELAAKSKFLRNRRKPDQ